MEFLIGCGALLIGIINAEFRLIYGFSSRFDGTGLACLLFTKG
jgi:hypothetical protein